MELKNIEMKHLVTLCLSILGALWLICSSLVQCAGKVHDANRDYELGIARGRAGCEQWNRYLCLV